MNIDGNFPTYEKQELIKTGVDAIKLAVDAGTIGKTPRRQVFTSNGTWIAPTGVTKVYITGGGGGGGGAVKFSSAAGVNGGSGGITSFGSILSINGGGGGKSGNGAVSGGLSGGAGGESGNGPKVVNNIIIGGDGGSSGPFKGGKGVSVSEDPVTNGGYCSGGGAVSVADYVSGGGGGDFLYERQVNVSPGTSYPITIGNGGSGATSNGTKAGNGGSGILIIEWWE